MSKISMRETLIWKAHVRKEIRTTHHWPNKYKWMMDMYGNMEKQLNEMSKKSEFLKEVFTDKEEDNRDIRPVPESMNHTYGWIANKEDFQNKIPDTMKLLSLPSHYKLVIPYDHPYWCYLRS
ncbi:uncharacterized protein LOC123685999 isoform X2 [Harmonia axyridis]|uniref:uncharacterized protein LOC123685999 isoform X2 n=1 Tax=Harmonia axyridis TaxID=115357 RepID=UPI001E277E21|nr:uncharacterized protein LOC123685999 isoform X2 [Harmonia axyridis]